jgi:predicted phage terminase large subunit-like protein
LLHPDSALSRLLENPGWTPFRYKAIIRYADQAPELWQQWRDIYCGLVADPETDEFLSRDDAREHALAFFKVHEDIMLAGSEVLWPERESYYQLMEMILTEGVAAFETEKQNNPQLGDDYPFRQLMEDAGSFTVEPDRLVRHPTSLQPVLMHELVDLCLYLDPSLGQTKRAKGNVSSDPDWSAAPVVAKDRRGYFYVLDTYMSQKDGPTAQCDAVADLVITWGVTKIALETNNFQSLLLNNLKQAVARRMLEVEHPWPIQWYEVNNTRNKILRIMTLEPMVAHKWLWFCTRLHPEATRQLREFRPLPDAGHDDFPDAVEGAVRVLRGMLKPSDSH